jgi:hypothetical protein
MNIDELFPLQAIDRHVRRVLSGQEAPPGLEYAILQPPIFYQRIISREEANMDVFFEDIVIPPWHQITGKLGEDSWVNGLGEPVEIVNGKWQLKETT